MRKICFTLATFLFYYPSIIIGLILSVFILPILFAVFGANGIFDYFEEQLNKKGTSK